MADDNEPLPPLTDEEYAVIRDTPEQIAAIFEKHGVSIDTLSDADVREEMKDTIATLRAMIEGYETTHPDAPKTGVVVHITKVMSGTEVDRILGELDRALDTLAWDTETGRSYYLTAFEDDERAAREHVRGVLVGVSATWSVHVAMR